MSLLNPIDSSASWNASLAKAMSSGIVWTALNFLGSQGAGFLIFLILATQLPPLVFGVVALSSVFADILIVEGRYAGKDAVMQADRYDQTSLNSSFIGFSFIALTCATALVFAAPMAAEFYNAPMIESYMPVYAAILTLIPWLSITDALIMRDLGFKVQTQRNIVATLVSGVLALAVAFSSYAIWAIVVQRFTLITVSLLFQVYYTRWLPSVGVDLRVTADFIRRFIPLWMTTSLNLTLPRLATLVFGARYDATTVGLLRGAQRIDESIRGPLISPLQGLWFPLMSKVKSDIVRERDIYSSIIKTAAFVGLPAFAGLAMVSDDFVAVILPDNYAGVAPLIFAVSITSLLVPIAWFNGMALSSLGSNKTALGVTFLNVITCAAAFLTFQNVSPAMALIVLYLPSLFVGLIGGILLQRRLQLSAWKHYSGLLPAYLAMGAMMIAVWAVRGQLPDTESLLRLPVSVFAGVLTYCGWLLMFHRDWTMQRIDLLRGRSH